MCARNECDNARHRRLTTSITFTCSPSVSRHCRVSWCFVLILVFTLSLVSDVSPFNRKVFIRQLHFITQTQFQVQSSFLLDVVVRLCPVIVNSICIPNSCTFHIEKTGLLRCCLYSRTPLVLQNSPATALKKSRFPYRNCKQDIEVFEAFSQSSKISAWLMSTSNCCDSSLDLLISCFWLMSLSECALCRCFSNISISLVTLFCHRASRSFTVEIEIQGIR